MTISISVLSQVVWSASSFLLAIILVRYLTMQEYGWFAIVISIRQFVLMLLGALVLTPLIVLAGRKAHDETKSDELMRLIMKIFQVLLLLLFAGAILVNGTSNLSGVSVALFLTGSLATEMQRKVCYINHKYVTDLFGGVFQLITTSLFLIFIGRSGSLTLDIALLLIGLITFLWSSAVNGNLWYPIPKQWDFSSLRHVWQIGKWSLGSNISGYVYNRCSTWLAFFILGPTSVAVLELGRQMVTIIQSFISAMANYWQPIFAKSVIVNSLPKFLRSVWVVSITQTIFGASILVVTLYFTPLFIELVTTRSSSDYAAATQVAWCLSMAMVAQLLWQHPNYALTVLRRPDFGFYAKLWSALTALLFGFVLTKSFGVIGAALSWTLGELVTLCFVFYYINRIARNSQVSVFGYAAP